MFCFCVCQAGVGSAAPFTWPPLLHADCAPRSDQETDPLQDHAVVTAANKQITSYYWGTFEKDCVVCCHNAALLLPDWANLNVLLLKAKHTNSVTRSTWVWATAVSTLGDIIAHFQLSLRHSGKEVGSEWIQSEEKMLLFWEGKICSGPNTLSRTDGALFLV